VLSFGNGTLASDWHRTLGLFFSQWKEERDWPKVRLEALKAGRTVSQLRAAVAEMDAVRAGLDAADRHDFDRRLAPHKERALRLVAHHAAIAEWVQAPAIQHDEPP